MTVRASAKRGKASARRVSAAETDAVLYAEFEAMMERSSRRLAELNANMDALLKRARTSRLTS